MSTLTPWASMWTSGWSSLAPSASLSWALVMTMGSKCHTPVVWVLAWHVGQPLTPSRGESRLVASLANPLLSLPPAWKRISSLGGSSSGQLCASSLGWKPLGRSRGKLRPQLGPGPSDPWDTVRCGVCGKSLDIGWGDPCCRGRGSLKVSGLKRDLPYCPCGIARTLAFLLSVLHGQPGLSGSAHLLCLPRGPLLSHVFYPGPL